MAAVGYVLYSIDTNMLQNLCCSASRVGSGTLHIFTHISLMFDLISAVTIVGVFMKTNYLLKALVQLKRLRDELFLTQLVVFKLALS